MESVFANKVQACSFLGRISSWKQLQFSALLIVAIYLCTYTDLLMWYCCCYGTHSLNVDQFKPD